MVFKRLTFVASLALAGCIGVSCSSKEDKAQYDKFYGSGRAEREESAGAGSFTPRQNTGETPAGDNAKVDPDTINSLSVTENADSEQGTSPAITEGVPVTAGKTVAEVVEKPDEAPKQKPVPADIAALLNKNTCSACHNPYQRLVGPAYSEVAKKKYSVDQIVALVYKPEPANWPGYPPMMAMPQVPKEEVVKLAKWINSL